MKKTRVVAIVVAAAAMIGVPATAASASPAVGANQVTGACQSSNYLPSTSFDQNVQCRLQEGPAARNGYTATVDGNMGVNSWKGVQNFLKKYYSYTGTVDGVPGSGTYAALQRWGADSNHSKLSRYTGPIDGVMGANSWKGVDSALEYDFYNPGARY